MDYQHQFIPVVRSRLEPGLEEIERLNPKVIEMIVDTHKNLKSGYNNLTQAIVENLGNMYYSHPHSPPGMLSKKNYILHETLGCVLPTDASCEKVFQHRFA